MYAQEQERALVSKIQTSPEFRRWILSKTKFPDLESRLVLARSDNPWYRSPRTGKDSETDILLVFEGKELSVRFALHIENKRLNDRFRPDQPTLYHERASDWLHAEKWGNYADYEVILIAPAAFYARNQQAASIFDRYISHEEIAEFVPEFGASDVPTSP